MACSGLSESLDGNLEVENQLEAKGAKQGPNHNLPSVLESLPSSSPTTGAISQGYGCRESNDQGSRGIPTPRQLPFQSRKDLPSPNWTLDAGKHGTASGLFPNFQ